MRWGLRDGGILKRRRTVQVTRRTDLTRGRNPAMLVIERYGRCPTIVVEIAINDWRFSPAFPSCLGVERVHLLRRTILHGLYH